MFEFLWDLLAKKACSLRQKFMSWQTSLHHIVVELAGGRSVAVAVGVAVTCGT